MTEKIVEVPYRPREVFKPYHSDQRRFSVTVAHRRAGKTVARINKLIRKAAECNKSNPRFAYIAPFYVQAKDIAWNYLLHYAQPIIALGGDINKSELSVRFPHNGAEIRLYGGENADRLRGLYFDGVAADEAQDLRPSLLSEVIMPTLADRKGWLDVSGTPRGWSNLLGQLVKTAQADPDEWFLQILPASMTGLIDKDELERQKALMTPAQYQQEFECDFDSAVKGAYYAEALHDLKVKKQITTVPYDMAKPVITAWDLGYSDSTAIWFAQIVGMELRIIDYHEASNTGLQEVVRDVKNKPYAYDRHYLPHDAAAKQLGADGQSISEQLVRLGLRNEVLPRTSDVMAGINMARNMISRCWFDELKCAQGLEALRAYRENYDEKRAVGLGPLHDWASHGADAFRYLCQAIDNHKTGTNEPLKYKRLGLA